MGKDWKGSARSVFVTMGSSNHSIEKRAELDYYATHPEASMWLLRLVPLHDRIWECAYGEGHLAMELEASGREVMKSDITDRTGSTEVIDFLNYKCDNMGGWKWISLRILHTRMLRNLWRKPWRLSLTDIMCACFFR